MKYKLLESLKVIKVVLKLLKYVVLGIIILPLGCNSKTGSSVHKRTPAEELWVKSENEYRTNEVQVAYKLILSARNELSAMWKANQGGLYYPYCLAILNGRLFIMARSMGKTNEAQEFLKESAFNWNQVGRDLRLPPTNFSADDIEAKIRRWDAKPEPIATKAVREP
jgi:hypothetical protein